MSAEFPPHPSGAESPAGGRWPGAPVNGVAPAPAVSVVVIVHNDAARLPYAVRSALGQTLRSVEVVVVDDHSTDGSHQVAHQLAATHPERVRVVRLPKNSGGCGAPRNQGVRHARGTYVVFLDSDDALDRDACRNLFQAAERTGADLVSGRCVRVHLRADGAGRADGADRTDGAVRGGPGGEGNAGGRVVRTTDWYPWLYARGRTLDSVAELPDLLAYDTLSTNKCYRRDFLLERDLRFPEDVHYEDLLFSARAYLAARRIALIPARVYHWRVWEGEPSDGAAPSISNRRRELANWADRITVHRRVDALLDEALLGEALPGAGGSPERADDPVSRVGLAALRLAKDVKFLRHDLVLLLRELPLLRPEYRERLSAPVADYLTGLAPEAYRQVRQVQASCALLLARGDWAHLMPTVDSLLAPGTLSVPLERRHGRTYWCVPPAPAGGESRSEPAGVLPSEPPRSEPAEESWAWRLLDVTDAGYATRPLRHLALGNRLTRWEALDERTVLLSGRVVNPLGRITADTRLRGRLELRAPRRNRRVHVVALASLRRGPRYLDWDAEVDVARTPRPWGLVDTRWEVRLVLEVDGVRMVTRPTVSGLADGEGRTGAEGRGAAERRAAAGNGASAPADGASGTVSGVEPPARTLLGMEPESVPARPRLSRLVGDRWRPGASPQGWLTLRLVGHGRLPGAVRGLLDRARGGRCAGAVSTAASRSRRWLGSRTTRARVYRLLLCRLPIRRGLVVFESHLGLRYGDNPRAVHEELRRQGLPHRAVWGHAGDPTGFPRDVTLVRRWSWRYLLALARAEYWVDNQGFPAALAKRPETRYLQTWHGSALKRMGGDLPEHQALSRRERDRAQRAVDRFDHFLVRGEHDVRTLVPALGVPAHTVLRTGYPRNDPLVAAHRRERSTGRREHGALPAALGLPPGRPVLLYAPTFRGPAAPGEATDGREERGFLDVAAFVRRFGDRYTLLVRSHYLSRLTLPSTPGGTVVDVSDQPDVTPLLLAADGLISDYSSVLFDYALLDRPMLLYVPDLRHYTERTRGTYLDPRAVAPGPLAETEGELFDALEDLPSVARRYTAARRRLVEEFGELDRGDAARRVVRAVFGERGARRVAEPSVDRARPRDPGVREHPVAAAWPTRTAPLEDGGPPPAGGTGG